MIKGRERRAGRGPAHGGEDAHERDRWLDLLILIPVLLFSMMVHELAHGWSRTAWATPRPRARGG